MPRLGRVLVRWITLLASRAQPVDGACIAPRPGRALAAYAALGRWGRATGSQLDPRLELLVAQLAAELSGCPWCIEQGRHRWRKAFLPLEPLMALTSYRTSPVFSDRDRAALGLAEAVARHREGEPAPGEQAIERARGLFTEPEIARITHTAAHEHFFNPETGAIGLDAAEAGFRHLGSGASPLTGAHR